MTDFSAWSDCSATCWEGSVMYMSLVTRKPVFGVSDQVRLKPACSATEASYRLEISDIETRGIILSRQRTTSAQSDLHLCCSHMAKTGFLMTWLIFIKIEHNRIQVFIENETKDGSSGVESFQNPNYVFLILLCLNRLLQHNSNSPIAKGAFRAALMALCLRTLIFSAVNRSICETSQVCLWVVICFFSGISHFTRPNDWHS